MLYDVSSSYLEGRCCELARLGYNRDGKTGKLQIVYGLLCAPDGCPVAIEVFEGDTADPRTLAAQIDKVSSGREGLLLRASHRTGYAGHASGSLDRCIRTPKRAVLNPPRGSTVQATALAVILRFALCSR